MNPLSHNTPNLSNDDAVQSRHAETSDFAALDWEDAIIHHNGKELRVKIPAGYNLISPVAQRRVEQVAMAALKDKDKVIEDLRRSRSSIQDECQSALAMNAYTFAELQRKIDVHRAARKSIAEEASQLRAALRRPLKWIINALMKRAISAERLLWEKEMQSNIAAAQANKVYADLP
jgi:hypothetical protein